MRPEPAAPIRVVTAASLFDGHDAAINIMRRVLQAAGAEVIHLGHNRSVHEIVTAALQEDVQAIAVSSYQGGHVEFFKYMVDRLRAAGASHVRVFGGGGGTIVPEEIRDLHAYGVTRLYAPQDGQRLGLAGMIDDLLGHCRFDPSVVAPPDVEAAAAGDWRALARLITAIDNGTLAPHLSARVAAAREAGRRVPVLGITGTGGAGKSSLTDELLRRLRLDYDDALRIAIIAVDPTRRRSGGALLGDRIRMNALDGERIFMRSLATRAGADGLPADLRAIVDACRLAGADLVVVETPGIGQGDAGIVPFVDLPLYVMTPEFGAASQLEKIDMLDYAEAVAINKFDRRGAQDALRDVRRQMQRNRQAFTHRPEDMPVFGTIASRFNDDGVTALYQHLREGLVAHGLPAGPCRLAPVSTRTSTRAAAIVPPARAGALAEIAAAVRGYKREVRACAEAARARQQAAAVRAMLAARGADTAAVDALAAECDAALPARARALIDAWPARRAAYAGTELVTAQRGREQRTALTSTSLSGTPIPRVALPRFTDEGELLRFLMLENLPGEYPFTAGVFPFKRGDEDPTRMFAGEGDPFRTNRRFKALSAHAPAKRLSTAFDSVTLYGCDPDERPDIYGKVGTSGVSIATLDDMRALYDGFDLCAPNNSVSMTINGPAPTILAMFLNTAIDQRLAAFEREHGRAPDRQEAAAVRSAALAAVRGTVQADILKEDQGQNTCLFSTEFSLKLMGDVQAWFIEHQVRNFYAVSISGYHIAEAGANPITQLAFTLANGLTYVEAWRARGMDIDDFAQNFSFFFSNGMDPEYAVIGRVARRIWALAMREYYGAGERAQKLKYHVQTSGRSLHAQEMNFNDIRTTLQALIGVYDHANSMHTNAYDEAITTPTAESVRRALAIQLIINREWGLAKNENPNQGAFIIEELTELVEEAVLAEFERIAERGGVLGAMEHGYQRGRIQDESMHYEHMKHDGSLPIVGVNTFLNPDPEPEQSIELARATQDEKSSQLARLRAFHERHRAEAPAAIERLKRTAMEGGNVFDVLMDAVRCCSLGQITQALFDVGGQYRRNM
ncbi:MAG: fused isobutyryl-CoA mutase/GTPase IcmF [Gammaproteobacteria bacterium]